MPIILKKANIVIIAKAHNPSIISPEWLKVKNIIVEEPREFIHTPEFSLFDSETFILTVDRVRLQIQTKIFELEFLKSLAKIVIDYICLLPHIPYESLGFNFIWRIENDAKISIPDIRVKFNAIDDISNIFSSNDVKYGCIIHAEKEDYLLRLTIVPKENDYITYNFNYHHNIKELDSDKNKEYLNNFVKLNENSKNIILNTLK